MSLRLVEQRRDRIKAMRNRSYASTEYYLKEGQEGWIDKKTFLAKFMVDLGVRERLASEYYACLLNAGYFEERQTIHDVEFRNVEAVQKNNAEKSKT